MDCDDVMLLLASREERTLTGIESARLEHHAAECASCGALVVQPPEEEWRVLVKIAQDALEDRDLLALPVVDPIVFADGKEISVGGMGRIVRAHDRRLGREVAIKEALDKDLRPRFEREVAITARLQHPAIVPIYEAGAWPDGTVFYTMRLVPGGRTLGHAIDDAKTLVERLALLPHIVAATEAVAYAHAQHVIHRDLKPANILVGEFGETVLIDWGLAKRLEPVDRKAEKHSVERTSAHVSHPDLTMAGQVIGTPCFMSPEQAAGKQVDERDDVYALGAILYHVLAGQPPYWDSNPGTKRSAELLVKATLLQPPTPVSKHAPEAPSDLVEIVERAMARTRSERFATAGAMAAELGRFAAGKLLATREYSLPELIWRWVKKHRAVVTVGGIALGALAVVAALAIVNVARSRAEERTARIEAQAAGAESEARQAALLEEQGRTELLGDEPERGLAYLAAAYRKGRDTPALRHLLAVATRNLYTPESELGPEVTTSVVLGVTGDGRIVTGSEDHALSSANPQPRLGTVKVWRDGRIESSFSTGATSSTFFDSPARTAITIDDRSKLVTAWDVRTGHQRWQHATTIAKNTWESAFDPAGRWLVVSSVVGAELRDAESGTVRAMWPGSPEIRVAFSADGKHVVVAGDDRVVRGWETSTFKLAGQLELRTKPFAIAFVGNDRVVIGGENAAFVWRIGAPKIEVELPGHRDRIFALAVNPTGDRIATGDRSGVVRLWSTSGDLLTETHDVRGVVAVLRWSPDGFLLAGAGDDARVRFWNHELLPIGSFPAFRSSARAVAWARDGMSLVTAGHFENVARTWGRPTTNDVARLPLPGVAYGASALLVANGTEVEVREIRTGAITHRLATPTRIGDFVLHGLTTSGDGLRVLIDGSSTEPEVYDVATGRLVSRVARYGGLSHDGRHVIVAAERANPPQVVDVATDKVIFSQRGPSVLDVSRDGTRVLGVVDAIPRMWSLANGAAIPLPDAAKLEGANAAEFDPAGRVYLVLGGSEGIIADAATGRELVRLRPDQGSTFEYARFDETGRRVATYLIRSVAVWDTATGELLVSVNNVLDDAFALTRDGSRLATGSADGSVQIWDAGTGRLLETLRGHRTRITSLAFSADGTRLVIQDGTSLGSIWDVALERRPIAAIDDLADRSCWRLVGDRLVTAP